MKRTSLSFSLIGQPYFHDEKLPNRLSRIVSFVLSHYYNLVRGPSLVLPQIAPRHRHLDHKDGTTVGHVKAIEWNNCAHKVFFNHNVFLRKLLRDCLSGPVLCRTRRDQGVLDPVDRPSGVSAFVAICWPPPTSAGCTTTSAAPYCAPVPLFPRIISPSLISDRTSVKPRGYDPWSHCWPLKRPIWMVIMWFRYTLLCKQPRSRRNEQAV